jgi:hypothetical protein
VNIGGNKALMQAWMQVWRNAIPHRFGQSTVQNIMVDWESGFRRPAASRTMSQPAGTSLIAVQ